MKFLKVFVSGNFQAINKIDSIQWLVFPNVMMGFVYPPFGGNFNLNIESGVGKQKVCECHEIFEYTDTGCGNTNDNCHVKF